MPMVNSTLDILGRPLKSLRVSVTDRCNLRCQYCMPEDEYVWLPKSSILSFEEIDRLVRIFAGAGVTKIRLTGGEPLLRHDLERLVAVLTGHSAIKDVALTTNGVLLARLSGALRKAGLGRITVSLDTLRADRYRKFTKATRLESVLEGIVAARDAGFEGLKLNSVIIRGFNDDEIVDLLEFAGQQGAELRYIEYMDVGGATDWSMEQVFSRDEILRVLSQRYGPVESLHDPRDASAPAQRYRLSDGRVFGIVASTTAPFCRSCDRARITADGMFFLCLYADRGIDLREPLRSGAPDEEIAAIVSSAWRARDDRGAEERAGVRSRGVLYQIEGLRADPHREMHTRGG